MLDQRIYYRWIVGANSGNFSCIGSWSQLYMVLSYTWFSAIHGSQLYMVLSLQGTISYTGYVGSAVLGTATSALACERRPTVLYILARLPLEQKSNDLLFSTSITAQLTLE